jgi:hypothetical protein
MDEDECGAIGRKRIGKGKPEYLEKTCPSVTLITTNPTLDDPGSKPGLSGGKPATNHLRYATACPTT